MSGIHLFGVRSRTLLFVLLCGCVPLWSQVPVKVKEKTDTVPLTLVYESRAAIERGIGFLLDRQTPDGAWLQSPPITALACIALHRGVAPNVGVMRERAVEKGRQFVLSNVRSDGAICAEDRSYVNYSTAICLSALAILGKPVDIEVMKNARHFLIGLQLDEDNKDNPTDRSNPFYGGIGYGSAGPKSPDLSNTQTALEALAMTDFLDREPYSQDPEEAVEGKLAWNKALAFLAAVQNLDKTKEGTWIVSGAKDGGFFYTPVSSKASDKLGDSDTLRSYGSMTYAGLKSMIYAQLDREDPRVKAAVDWACQHYTLDENPGMGPEGHFYYLHTFAKALAVLGEDVLTTADGTPRRWRVDLIQKLLQLQKGEGQWVNDASGRWQESIPELVTCYALISLEVALGDRIRVEK